MSLFFVSGLAGVLVVGLALPFATGLGWVARESATGFQELPTDVELGALPERSRVVEADGSTLATFYSENRTYVPLHKVSQVMQDATIAIEDHRFFDHGPIDMKGTIRAFIGNVEAGEITAGGSTLTQQYAKLLRRSQADSEAEAAEAVEESYGRKLSELRLAIEIERELTKEEILERYINIAYYGASVYGVEEAANRYFSTSAEKLTLPQAATLAGLVQRPSAYDPTQNPEAALERRNVVIDRMAELGMVSAAKAEKAKKTKLGLDVRPVRNGCSATWAPFYCQYVQNELEIILGDEADDLLYQGGLTIETTLQRKPQKAAQDAIADYVAPKDSSAAALASVEPGTGAIKALTHSREWGDGKGETHFNYAVDRTYRVDGESYDMGGGDGFQPGSTFKVFVAAAALKQGISVNTPIQSPPELDMAGEQWATCSQPYIGPDDWTPGNYPGSPAGTMNLRTAIEKSVNTYFLQLSQQTGLCDPWTIATQAGVSFSNGKPLEQVGSFTLGVNTVSPLSMAESYAMFAARGMHCEPYAITRVIGRDGEVLFEREPNCNRVLDEGVADAMNDLLQGVVSNPGATGNAMQLAGGRPAAGKTGTTNGVKAVWWVGYTPQLSTAVGLSDPDPPADNPDWTLEGRTFNGVYYANVCGGCIPGPIWKQMMDNALADEQILPFVPADQSVLQGETSRVPDVRGMDVQQAHQVLSQAGFQVRVAEERVESNVPPNQVVEVDPAPWSWLTVGSEVTITVSKGKGGDNCIPLPFFNDCEEEGGGNGDGGGGGDGGGNDGGGNDGPGNGGGNGDENTDGQTTDDGLVDGLIGDG